MSETSLSVPAKGRYGKSTAAPGLIVEERRDLSIVSVMVRKGRQAALASAAEQAFGAILPATPRHESGRGLAFVWSGLGHWLAIAEAGAGKDLEAEMREKIGALASVADQSAGKFVLRVTGARVRETLAKGLPIDLHPTVFGPGDTALTNAAHIGLQIWQIDEAPTYEIAIPRGYAGSFWDWLAASAAEYGCEVLSPRG